MTTKFYSKSSTTYISDINGKKTFEHVEVENDNGKKTVKKITNNGNKIEDKKVKKFANKMKKLLLS